MINMNQITILLKDYADEHIKSLGLKYQRIDEGLKVLVNDIPYTIKDGYYQDPDEQLCEHYGINHDLVDSIEYN